MPFLSNLPASELIYRLGWTLLHSLWLGSAVAIAFALATAALRRRSPQARYLAGCTALGLMVGLVIATFLVVPAPSARMLQLASAPAGIAITHADMPTMPPVQEATGPIAAPAPIVSPAHPAEPALSATPAPRAPLGERWSKAVEPALPWLVLGWTLGVCALGLWQLAGWLAVKRLWRSAFPVQDESLAVSARRLARQLRVARPVRVLESALVRVPTVIGWLRPVVLLPIGLAAGLSPQQVEAILTHEIAHIRRCDYLINLLQTLIETLLFYHPAVWWISARIRAERENCCDDMALSLGAERISYAESLLHLATARLNSPKSAASSRHLAPALNAVDRPSQLRRRIARLLGVAENPSRLSRSWPAALILLLALTIVSVLTYGNPPTADSNLAAAPRSTQPGFEVSTAAGAAADADAQAQRAIKQAIDIHFDDTTLAEVMKQVRDKCGLARIDVDWKALREVGVLPDRKITLSFQSVPADTVLRLVLQQAIPEGAKDSLSFRIADGSVLVSTRRAMLAPTRQTQTYDLRDLLTPVLHYDFDDAPDSKLSDSERLVKKAAERQMRSKQITGLIQDTVAAPQDWPAGGGKLCSLSVVGDQLIVDAPQEYQRDLVRLLTQLREARALRISSEYQIVECDQELLNQLILSNDPANPKATAFAYVDDTQMAKIVEQAQARHLLVWTTLPKLTLDNGQRGMAKSLVETREFIGGKSVTIATGAEWTIESTVSANRKYVTSTIRLRLRGRSRAVEGTPVEKRAETNSTISAPDASRGGSLVMLLPGDPDILSDLRWHYGRRDASESPAPASKTSLLLVVRARIVKVNAGDVPATQPATPRGEVTTGPVAELIAQLGHENYQRREEATGKLVEIGWAALPALREAQKHKDPEVVARATRAIEEILARIEVRRDELRKAAEEAAKGEDAAAGRRAYQALLAVPEPQLRDARAAIKLFEGRQDWPELATAYEAAAEAMWRVTHQPSEAFIRLASAPPPGLVRGNEGGFVQVQTALDGEWSNGKGDPENWVDWIRRKQKELVLERIRVLDKLGKLCLERLDAPRRAVAAYEAAGWEVPLCTEPLDKLIPQMWPKRSVAPEKVLALDMPAGAAMIRADALSTLADAQVKAGDLRGAAETRTRAMLAMMIPDKGDWNAHGPAGQAEAFWQVVNRLPPDKPLPPTLWLNVLDRDKPTLDFPAPEEGPHKYPLSFPGPRLVIRPGQKAKTLTVSADMETLGGSGGVRCFTMIDGKAADLGWVQWHDDNRKGHEWRTATFDMPEGIGIIRLEITPYNGSDFHVRAKVSAAFAPPATPATQPAAGEWGKPNAGVQARLQPDKTTWQAGQTPSFKADIRNTGDNTYSVAQAQELCELELDGAIYRWVGAIDVKSSHLPSGREYSDIPITLDKSWQRAQPRILGRAEGVQPDSALVLTPGRHTLRVIFSCDGGSAHRNLKVESNQVEFDVLRPAAPATQPATFAAAARDAFSLDPAKRRQGITILSESKFGGDLAYVRMYRLVSNDPDDAVRAASVKALGEHGTAEDATLVKRLLKDEDEVVRSEAAKALERLERRTNALATQPAAR